MAGFYLTENSWAGASLLVRRGDASLAEGEKTRRQVLRGNLPGSSAGSLPGFFPAPPGSYSVYRQISSHPTVALVQSIVKSPVAANEWQLRKRNEDVPDLWVKFIENTVLPMRRKIAWDMMRSLEFGWSPFEKVWEYRRVDLGDGDFADAMVLEELKPLVWDHTEFAEENGRVTGLWNRMPGYQPVFLGANKCCWHLNDARAGDVYGRSRHENIRQRWSEAEQVTQRMAQYVRKIAGTVVQLHYPEGESRDPAGSLRPNQWHAQMVLDHVAAGDSVMFPNGYASIDARIDPQGAYELAGKSQWVLSTLTAGGPDYASGLVKVLEFLDQQIFHGWLRPARSGLEARYGSRADAQKHSETGIYDCELISQEIADTVNHSIIDDLLELNFGFRARGAVYAVPLPISDESIQGKLQVLKAIVGSQFGGMVVGRLDVNSLIDDLGIRLNDVDPLVQQTTSMTESKPASPADSPALPAKGGPAGKPTAGRDAAARMLKDAGYSDDEIGRKLARKAKS